MIKSHLCKPHLVSLSSSNSRQWDVPQASRWCPPYRILPNTCTNISLKFEDKFNRQTMWGQWRLKYTEVQSQQMAFTQSPSLRNNPMIVTNFLIFTDRQSDKIETQARNTSSGPTWFQHVVTIVTNQFWVLGQFGTKILKAYNSAPRGQIDKILQVRL